VGYLQNLLPTVEDGLSAETNRARYATDPVLWARDFLGVQLWKRQQDICYSVRDEHNTAVAAGHGVGKSYVAGIIVAWWVDTHPLDETFVASTAPTVDQVAILWDNIRVIHALADRRHQEYLRRKAEGVPLADYAACDHALPGSITGDHKWKRPLGMLIGQGRKPPDAKGDVAFQGRHATYLLAIGDEAVGINDAFLEALGNIATSEFNRILLLANPTDPSSAMAKIWKTKSPDWVRMHISVLDSPKIKPDPDFDVSKAPALSDQGYVNEKLRDWGEDDPRYISRVLGEWAFDAGNTVFTEVELARAINTVVLPDPNARIQHGWDIARMGADATIGFWAREGEVWETDPETGKPTKATGRRGLYVRKVARWTKAPLVGDDPKNLGSAQRIDKHAKADGAKILAIDASGLGSGVVDGLRQIGTASYSIVEIFGGAASSDKRAYVNARAEQYFELKRRFFAGEIDLDGSEETLFDELRGVIYEYNDQGAKKIEAKDAMKRRGAKSPDEADALWYAAMDISALIDDPLAGAQKGDVYRYDPWEMLNRARSGPGMPI